MVQNTGIIILLSYPDTIVRPPYWEKSSKIWPKIGIGSKHGVKAGHAALLLLKKGAPTINYFDFGRYITTYSKGRLRSKETDAELHVNIQAKYKNGNLINLKDILLWIERHPEKTHGEGRLIASINTEIDYNKALTFINSLISKKEIPYGAFIKNGSNCARFINDTLTFACTNTNIVKALKKSNNLTPSPIGNVIKGHTTNKIYKVLNGTIKNYTNRSIIKEYRKTFFSKHKVTLNIEGTEIPKKNCTPPKNAFWLGGIGSGAWFKIEDKITENNYKIARYNADALKDFESVFKLDSSNFNVLNTYKIIHPTNCLEVVIEQNNNTYILKRV